MKDDKPFLAFLGVLAGGTLFALVAILLSALSVKLL